MVFDDDLPLDLRRLIHSEIFWEYDRSFDPSCGVVPGSDEYIRLRSEYVSDVYVRRLAGLRSFPSSLDSLRGLPFFVDGDDYLNPVNLSDLDLHQSNALLFGDPPSRFGRLWYSLTHPRSLFGRKKKG